MPNVQIFGDSNDVRGQASQGVDDMMRTMLSFRQMAFEREMAKKQMQREAELFPLRKGLLEAQRDRAGFELERAKLELEEWKGSKDYREKVQDLNIKAKEGVVAQQDAATMASLTNTMNKGLEGVTSAKTPEDFENKKKAFVTMLEGFEGKEDLARVVNGLQYEDSYSPTFGDMIGDAITGLVKKNPALREGIAQLKLMHDTGLMPGPESMLDPDSPQNVIAQQIQGKVLEGIFGASESGTAGTPGDAAVSPTPDTGDSDDDSVPRGTTLKEELRKVGGVVAEMAEPSGKHLDRAIKRVESSRKKQYGKDYNKYFSKVTGGKDPLKRGVGLRDKLVKDLRYSPEAYYGEDVTDAQKASFFQNHLQHIVDTMTKESNLPWHDETRLDSGKVRMIYASEGDPEGYIKWEVRNKLRDLLDALNKTDNKGALIKAFANELKDEAVQGFDREFRTQTAELISLIADMSGLLGEEKDK